MFFTKLAVIYEMVDNFSNVFGAVQLYLQARVSAQYMKPTG